MAEPTDLFGEPVGPAQLSLFGPGENQMRAPTQVYSPDPEAIRLRLHAILMKAQRAATMPWPDRELRMWQTVFPNLTNWLPEAEAQQLRFDFFQEIERLQAA